MERERKYAAFISYRHISPDKEIAKALQFALEYNLVRPNKNVPRHIRKVFLDTSELPTMEDLDEGILQALDQSECLFVICSPDLPQSKYCMREINYFKERHGGSLDRVATLLVRGDPRESYPEALRTKLVPDPEDPSRKLQVEVEPLSADIRGKNLLHSLWKLFSSEYLRLAARYYRCAYDELKKRHKRNMIGAAAGVMAVVLSLSGVMLAKEQQVQTTKANTYASYANEQTQKGNELLALALCNHTRCKHTPAYTAALRSALVQWDYKQNSVPVAKVMEAEYSYGALTNYYVSASGNQLVVADGNNWQITNAYDGTLIRQFPYESAFVMGTRPKTYITLTSQPDGTGEFYDYVQLMDLQTDQLIAEFPFRQASEAAPEYKVISVAESDGQLNILKDHDQEVAYFTTDGRQLTKEQYTQLLLSYTQLQESADPFALVFDKLRKEYVVKDANGTQVLTIGSSYQNAAFSEDWSLFAWSADDAISVYDLENRTLLSQQNLEDRQVQSLHLLRGSSYCVVGYRYGESTFGAGTRSDILDWRSGETLLTVDGTVLLSPTEQAFFTVLQGTITRYHYTQLDLTAQSEVIAHRGDRCLSGEAGAWVLRNTQTGKQLFTSDCQLACADEALEHILTADAQLLTCYDQNGSVVWTQSGHAVAIAMAPRGDRCAWLDDRGSLQVLNTVDGTQLYQLSAPQVGQVTQLLVSERGVGVLGTDNGVWIPENGESVSLGAFPRGELFFNGVLILESDARVNDFRIFDTARGSLLAPFADNTGAWAYAPNTGYLVRHIEASGNHPALYLEVWQLKAGSTKCLDSIPLPEKFVDYLTVDSTGQWLTAASGGRSFVYTLEDRFQALNVRGQVYYEANALYGHTVFGAYQYAMPMHDPDRLLELAAEALTGPLGTRTLTREEQKHYEIAKE